MAEPQWTSDRAIGELPGLEAKTQTGTPTTEAKATTQVTTHVTTQVVGLLKAARTPQPRDQLQEAIGLRNREHFRKAHLEPLLAAGLLTMIIPDKPRSSRQRYVRTPEGEAFLNVKGSNGQKVVLLNATGPGTMSGEREQERTT